MNALWLLIPLVALSVVEYRVDVGPFSMTLMEPLVLLFSAWVLLPALWQRRLRLTEPLVLLFMAMTVWALLIRLFGGDGRRGLSDVRDWAIPTLFLLALWNSERRQVNTWVFVFVVVTALTSVLAMIQAQVNGLRPFVVEGAFYKTGLVPEFDYLGRMERASFGVGLLGHPNQLGILLTYGLFLTWAWLRSLGSRGGLARYLLLAIPALGLLVSYARTSILICVALAGVLILYDLTKTPRRFALVALMGVGVTALLTPLLLTVMPDTVLGTVGWRVELWNTALDVVRDNPAILVYGNGLALFAEEAFYGQPHNLYIYMLLQYGLMGLLFVFAVLLLVMGMGGIAWQKGLFRQDALLAPLWVVLLGQFGTAMLETTWLEVQGRSWFVFSCAVFLAALVRAEQALPVARAVTPDLTTAPRPIPSLGD